MPVVHIVQLDLHEIPFELIVSGEQVIEHFHISVVGKAQMPDTSRFPFFKQKVEQSVIEKTLHQKGHTTPNTHDMEQVIIEVIGLQVLERPAIHLY